MNKIRVARDTKSPTGYIICVGDAIDGINASITVVNLYKMYVEALDLAHRLHEELNKIAQIEIDSAKVKSSRGKK